MSKTNLVVKDLNGLFLSLCDVYNSYNSGSLDEKEVATFLKSAHEMVGVKNQILKDNKFKLSLKANKKK